MLKIYLLQHFAMAESCDALLCVLYYMVMCCQIAASLFAVSIIMP